MIRAFDLAFEHRNPVLILADAILGQMKEPITAWKPEGVEPDAEAADWSLSGAKGRPNRVLKSLFLEEGSLAGQNRKLQEKYRKLEAIAEAEACLCDDAELVLVAYGSIGRIAKSALRELRAEGVKVGLLRPVTLFPFPSAQLRALAEQGKRFLTLEHNCGQMVEDVRLAIRGVADSDFFGVMPGDLPTPDDFIAPIRECLAR